MIASVFQLSSRYNEKSIILASHEKENERVLLVSTFQAKAKKQNINLLCSPLINYTKLTQGHNWLMDTEITSAKKKKKKFHKQFHKMKESHGCTEIPYLPSKFTQSHNWPIHITEREELE
ncbi:hypothetical protein RYX36_018867 [Vicia faba]